MLVNQQLAWGLGNKHSVIMKAWNQQSGQLASYRFILSIAFGKFLIFQYFIVSRQKDAAVGKIVEDLYSRSALR